MFTETDVNNGRMPGRDFFRSRKQLQSLEPFPCLCLTARHRVDVARQHVSLQVASSPGHTQRLEGFLVLVFLDVREREEEVRVAETRIHLEYAAEFSDGGVVLSGQVQNGACHDLRRR